MIIRKISIGPDYKDSMHYMQSQVVLKGNSTIHLIKQDTDGSVLIFIEKGDEVILWKKINHNVPFILEFDLDF